MKRLIQISLCFAGLALLAGPALAQDVLNSPAEGVLVDPQPESIAPRLPARGLYLDEDGTFSGMVTTIDAQTLELVPVPNATVTFMQNKAVVVQVKTDTHGAFKTNGLSPMGVYSVFVTADDMIAVFATVMRPASDAPGAENAVAKKEKRANDLTLVQLEQEGGQDVMSSADGTPFQGVPLSDFQAYFGGMQTPNTLPPTTAAGGGGGGGGGSGGGGGALAGLAGLAALGAIGSDNDAPQVASPFETD